jgi:hypothetical protein
MRNIIDKFKAEVNTRGLDFADRISLLLEFAEKLSIPLCSNEELIKEYSREKQ